MTECALMIMSWKPVCWSCHLSIRPSDFWLVHSFFHTFTIYYFNSRSCSLWLSSSFDWDVESARRSAAASMAYLSTWCCCCLRLEALSDTPCDGCISLLDRSRPPSLYPFPTIPACLGRNVVSVVTVWSLAGLWITVGCHPPYSRDMEWFGMNQIVHTNFKCLLSQSVSYSYLLAIVTTFIGIGASTTSTTTRIRYS